MLESILLWVIMIGLTATASPGASTLKTYFIGNSFTWDTQPHNISTATTFPDGQERDIGWSIYSGKSLSYIVDNPTLAVTEVGLVAADFEPDPNYTRNFQHQVRLNPQPGFQDTGGWLGMGNGSAFPSCLCKLPGGSGQSYPSPRTAQRLP